MSRFGNFRWLAVFILFFCLAAPGYAAQPDSLPDQALVNRPADAPALSIPQFSDLQERLDNGENVRVIVRLRDDVEVADGFMSEGQLKSPQAIAAQQRKIERLQDKVANRLPNKGQGKTKRFKHIPFMAAEVDQGGFEELINSPEVDFIEVDVPVSPSLSQSIPLIGGDGGGLFSGYSGAGQAVAILDTGVETSHPMFTGRIVEEACFSTTVSGQSVSVCPNGQNEQIGSGSGVNCNAGIAGCDHGTHVAGIAAGNGGGLTGVAKDADIIAVQVFANFSGSAMSWSSDQLKALEHIYSLRSSYDIASVNMSLGGGFYTADCDASRAALKAAIDNLRSVGIATVIATGNDGYTTGISAPSCISTAVSVGSTDKSDVIASYSNSSSLVELLAPGSAITAAVPGGSYAVKYGTSMATPHVAGAWAVVKSKAPTATVDEVLAALQTTGVNVTDARNGITKPRIDVDSALGQFVVDPRLQLSATSYSVTEGDGTVTITVRRDGSSSGAVTVDWATSAGTATAGNDYITGSGTVSFADGDLADKTFTVVIPEDGGTPEPAETFTVTLSNPTGGAILGTRTSAQVTINDNDYLSVAGTVTFDGSPLSGVTMTASNGGSCSASAADGSYSCQINYAWTGSITPSKTGFTFAPGALSFSNLTANQSSQDFVASLGIDTPWMDDTVPTGGNGQVFGDSWTWVTSSPNPYSGSKAHQSDQVSGLHFHYFTGATDTMDVAVGDSLYTYVYLDPVNPPRELMLMWQAGSTWYRAYWGENLIGYGTDGTSTRRYVGNLPATGQWVKISVPASEVDLEGKSVSGMAFVLYDGQVTWDQTGTSVVPPIPELQFSAASYSVAEDGGSATITVTRAKESAGAVSVQYATSDGTAAAGSDYTSGSGTINFADGDSVAKTFTVAISNDASTEPLETINLTLSNPTGGAILGGQSTAVLTIVDDEVITVSGQVTLSGSGLAGVSFDISGGGSCTASDANGDFSCEVPYDWTGAITPSKAGNVFSPSTLSFSNVTSNQTGQDFTATIMTGTAWFDDTLPTGAGGAVYGDSWNWVASSPSPFSGTVAHQSDLVSGLHFHYFTGASETMDVSVGDSIYTYVYLDPANPPREIMLMWYAGSTWYRAYWGENLIGYGIDGTSTRRYVGNLPATGQWVKLTVPASDVDLEGKSVSGMAFTLYDGRVTWDQTGTEVIPPSPELQFSAATYSVAEDGGTASITVSRSGSSIGAVSVQYSMSDGTATAGSDYTSASAIINFVDGDSADKTFTVSITDDATAELNETLTLSLGNATGGAILGAIDSTVLTIVDNDMINITGTVTQGGSGLAGVTLTGTGATCSATDANGDFSCEVSYGWTGSLVPSKSGTTFNPASLAFSNVTTDQSGQDFVSYADLTISGTITQSGSGESGVTLTASGASCSVSDGNGDYSCTVAYNWSGTLVPSKASTTFTPASIAFSNITSNQANQDFTATFDSGIRTISGTITQSGSGESGVALSATGATCSNTDANGDYSCDVATGWSGTLVPSKSGLSFTPSSISFSNVTTNQSGKDFTAAVATGIIWFDDSVPTGSSVKVFGDSWNWVTSSPAPYSGTSAHQSDLVAGLHFHYFTDTPNTLDVEVGDSLYTYVYLDPANPPREIMLMWRAGTTYYRAYWGENLIGYGTDGTSTRRYVGALPATGQWVKLMLPAADVDLEGKSINGMVFALYDGRVTWDQSGTTTVPPVPEVGFSTSSFSVDEDAGTATITVSRSGSNTGAISVDYATSNGSATAGSDYTASSGTLNFGDGDGADKTFTVSITNDGTAEAWETINLALSNPGGGASLAGQSSAVLTIVDDEVVTVTGQVTRSGSGLSGVTITADNGGSCSNTDGSGNYSCDVPYDWTGSLVPSLDGNTFSPASLSFSNVTSNQSGQDFVATEIVGTPWFDDAVPTGASQLVYGDSWNWVTSSPAPFSGTSAHQSDLVAGLHFHYFLNAPNQMSVATGDSIYTYVYLDPANPPREIMLMFRTGTTWYRAYWGEDLIAYGTNGSSTRRYMGALPATGQWVKLSIPASQVDLEGKSVNGIAFTLYDGRVTWDQTGTEPAP